jgi:hypothetical protein
MRGGSAAASWSRRDVEAARWRSRQQPGLQVRAEIQTGSKRLPLLEGQAGALLAELAPKQQADFVVEHELKEAGVHIMICSASYLDAACEERKARSPALTRRHPRRWG